MNKIITILLVLAATGVMAQETPPEGWPRHYEGEGNRLVVYQPQIQSWDKYEHMLIMAAIEVTPAGEKQGVFGALYVDADTETDLKSRMVLFQNVKITGIKFPDVEASTASRCNQIVRSLLHPKASIPISLDRVIAAMERSELERRTVQVNLDPPPIHYSQKPAILVLFMGDPKLEPVENTKLLFAVNTNWDLFLETGTSRYYLLNNESWFTTNDLLGGVWQPARKLPDGLKKLPANENWQDVRKNLPGKPSAVVPAVFVSTQPAELIVTNGPVSLSPIKGTQLLYATNTASDLFFHSKEGNYYFLTAGRWFRAGNLKGPWSAASQDLPADFKRIPEKHAKGYVLSSVPGTEEAQAAVLLASIPQKATVDRKEATVKVVYEGKPNFVNIQNTTVSYAVNTPNSVFLVDSAYYCCQQGIWFCSPAANGPWVVCTAVPQAIYTIPPTHPMYNVTYVYVYDSTPDTVTMGYTSGYTGTYVAATGLLMFGLGYAIGHSAADDYPYYHYGPHYYSYGCAARYDYYRGGYYRSSNYYGPYGGAGRSAAYNPATGTYGRGAYRYGPSGGAYAREAYNPYQDRYAAQAGVQTPYGSWGRSVTTKGDEWARAGHRSTAGGTVAGFETSKGAKGVAGHSKVTGESGFAAKSKSGDMYVGKDGNVYKRNESGDWQKRSGGSWESVERTKPTQPPEKAARPQTRPTGTPAQTQVRAEPRTAEQLNQEYRSRRTGESRTREYQRSASRESVGGRSRGGGGRGR